MNKNVLCLVVLVCLPVLGQTYTCTQPVLDQAVQDGFLNYVIINCVRATAGPNLNVLGQTPKRLFKCFSDWMILHADSPFPIAPANGCMSSFTGMVAYLQSMFEGLPPIPMGYDAKTNQITVSDEMLVRMLDPIRTFRSTAGPTIGIRCKASTVRKLSDAGFYSAMITNTIANPYDYSGAKNPIATLATPADGGDGMCYICYRFAYYDILSGSGNSPGQLAELCGDDPHSLGCLNIPPVITALARFKECTGGFDMIFADALCSVSDMDEIQQLIPAPYFAFTHCAYFPSEGFCVTLDAYLAKIRADSDADCVLCYSEFRAAVRANTEDASAVAACTGASDVWDVHCVSAQHTALANFQACSGYAMDVTEPVKDDVHPVASAPITPAIGSATTTTADPTTTSETIPSPTTKSVSAIGSHVGVQLLLTMSLLATL